MGWLLGSTLQSSSLPTRSAFRFLPTQRLKLPHAVVQQVRAVKPGGAADQAGIVPGDLIVAVNGKSISSMDELFRELGTKAPGTEVMITILSADETNLSNRKVVLMN